MGDEEIRQFMAQLLAKLDVIAEKVTKLYDQTDAARWEYIQNLPKPPPREVTDEEHRQLELQRYRDQIDAMPTY